MFTLSAHDRPSSSLRRALHRRCPALLLLAVGNALATPFSYQGTLYSQGELAQGPHRMKLALYTAPSGGLLVAKVLELENVQVERGRFNADAELPPAIDRYDTLWLQVSVDDGQGFVDLPQREMFQPKAANACWSTSGNAGTDALVDFLGTSDAQPVALRVNASRAFYLDAGTPLGISPNVIGGNPQNEVKTGVRGAFIGGGGAVQGVDSDFPVVTPNYVSSHYSVIGGGTGNVAGNSNLVTTSHATVSGGRDNAARGQTSFVGGGYSNTAEGNYSAVVGGQSNTTGFLASHSIVAGGNLNSVIGAMSAIGGGESNQVLGKTGVVAGGTGNVIAAQSDSTIAGGRGNGIDAIGGGIGGGQDNLVVGDYGAVPGGYKNIAAGRASFAAGANASASHNGAFVWNDLSSPSGTNSTGNNQFIVRAAGGVGIGTNAPQNQLHVVESVTGVANPANHVMQIENASTTGTPDVLALKIRTTGNPDGGFNFITFFDGDYVSGAGGTDESLGAIQGNGAGGVVLAGPGNDYAEWLPKRDAREEIHPGDVVGVINGRVSRDTADAQLLMVASTGAIVAGNDPGMSERKSHALVAFLGQAEVRVAGAASPGDYLLPSGRKDGLAIALAPEALPPTRGAEIIGRVWQVLERGDRTRVKAVVGLARVDTVAASQANDLRKELQALRAELSAQREQIAQLQQARSHVVSSVASVVAEH